jgi:hypothetical protein
MLVSEDGQRCYERQQTLLEPRLAAVPGQAARHERATPCDQNGQPQARASDRAPTRRLTGQPAQGNKQPMSGCLGWSARPVTAPPPGLRAVLARPIRVLNWVREFSWFERHKLRDRLILDSACRPGVPVAFVTGRGLRTNCSRRRDEWVAAVQAVEKAALAYKRAFRSRRPLLV